MDNITRNSTCLVYGICCADKMVNEPDNDCLINFLKICLSIKKRGHIIVNDIKQKLLEDGSFNLKHESELFVYVTPLAFATIYEYNYHDVESLIREFIIDIFEIHNEGLTKLLCEWVYLLHDILFGKISKDDILTILPELKDTYNMNNIANSDIDIWRKDFIEGLWCFIHSSNWFDAVDGALMWIPNPNAYISAIVGAISGLYYGLDSIPTEIRNSAQESFELDKYCF